MLREKYKDRIDIRVGLEGDYIEGYEADIERIIQAYPWDYVIGSVHFFWVNGTLPTTGKPTAGSRGTPTRCTNSTMMQ